MRTSIFYDSRHAEHSPPPLVPELPSRIDFCAEALADVYPPESYIQADPAPRDVLESVHGPRYLEALEKACLDGGGWVDPNVFLSPGSFDAAVRASGACCMAAGAALQGESSFCLIRPPGHHALADSAMGYCLINNAAVGAAFAIARGASRVAIVDIDVHHGNGTQEIFWNDPNVLYVSLHQYPWYPFTTGSAEETGRSDAPESNLNVPMRSGSGDSEYEAAMHQRAVPALQKFGPEVLIVSCGFDAHAGEDRALGLQLLTNGGYATLARMLTDVAAGAGAGVFGLLEGGYRPESLAAVRPVVSELLGNGKASH